MAEKIGAILLAAGMSRRSGDVNKLLASINGATMLLSAAETLIASACAPVVVVTGHEAERIEQALTGQDVEIVHNPEFETGMASSVRAGVRALAGRVDGALVALGDMPHVKGSTVASLIDAFDPARGHEICLPVDKGRPGNPVLFGHRFFDALQRIEGDRGGKPILQQYPESVVEVEVDDAGIHLDHDVV